MAKDPIRRLKVLVLSVGLGSLAGIGFVGAAQAGQAQDDRESINTLLATTPKNTQRLHELEGSESGHENIAGAAGFTALGIATGLAAAFSGKPRPKVYRGR